MKKLSFKETNKKIAEKVVSSYQTVEDAKKRLKEKGEKI